MCAGHKNSKNHVLVTAELFLALGTKQLGNSERESHIEKVILGGDDPEIARVKTTWTQPPASVQSSTKTHHQPYLLRCQSKKDHCMYSSQVNFRE